MEPTKPPECGSFANYVWSNEQEKAELEKHCRRRDMFSMQAQWLAFYVEQLASLGHVDALFVQGGTALETMQNFVQLYREACEKAQKLPVAERSEVNPYDPDI